MSTTLEDALDAAGIDVSSASSIKMGGAADYLEISKTDGPLRVRGDGTMWQDMIADLFGKRINNNAGKVDYDWDENAIKFQANGSLSNAVDRVGGNQEINHDFKVGTNIVFKPHIHWFQDASTEFVMSAQYRLQKNGSAKTTSWTALSTTVNSTNNIFTYSSGMINQITKFPDITLTCGISDTIQWQMTRTDALSGNMLVYFFDLHGEVDALGSEAEYTKET